MSEEKTAEEKAKEEAEEKAKEEAEEKAKEEAEANMTELEKAQKAAADAEAGREAAEKAKAEAELSSLRTRVGTEKGLPSTLADRLQGEDEESIRADADEMVKTLSETDGNKWPDFGQGKGKGESGAPGIAAFAEGAGDPALQEEGEK